MILSYSVPGFPDKILGDIKKHTFREDENKRWHFGRKIEHWWRNPRNKTLGPYEIKKGTCFHVGEAVIMRHKDFEQLVVCIDGLFYPAEQVAINDGFESAIQFEQYFLPKMECWGVGIYAWVGRCIFFEPISVVYPKPHLTILTSNGVDFKPNFYSPYLIIQQWPDLLKPIQLTS